MIPSMEIKERLLNIKLPPKKSAFLWGPRQVGKSHWIRHHLKEAVLIDFLKTDIFSDYASRPHLLRERYSDTGQLIVIDEVQMIPDILNEVHWMIENTHSAFLLTGSSARKLRQKHANLLGGRAWRYTMSPLCSAEIKDLNIEHAIGSGFLPAILTSPEPTQELRAYVANYLKEEIATEATIRNIPAFAEFLYVAALTSGELINYNNVAREAGVSAKVVRNYFQILEDTLLGFRLQPWKKAKTRRLIETEKFYLFDVGVSNYLARQKPSFGTPAFGKSFEHFILMELKAYQAYRNPELLLHYWRTSTGLEVDFILGDMDIALEVKSSKRVHETDTKALKTLQDEYDVKQTFLISFEETPKIISDNIQCLPWKMFLEKLWNGDFDADLL